MYTNMNIIYSQNTVDTKDRQSLTTKTKDPWKRKKADVVTRVSQVFMLFLSNTSCYKTCFYLSMILKNIIVSGKKARKC